MRHVWQHRLEKCCSDMLEPLHKGKRISEIALRWDFNDLSHFSREFRQRFGCAPREVVANRDSCSDSSVRARVGEPLKNKI